MNGVLVMHALSCKLLFQSAHVQHFGLPRDEAKTLNQDQQQQHQQSDDKQNKSKQDEDEEKRFSSNADNNAGMRDPMMICNMIASLHLNATHQANQAIQAALQQAQQAADQEANPTQTQQTHHDATAFAASASLNLATEMTRLMREQPLEMIRGNGVTFFIRHSSEYNIIACVIANSTLVDPQTGQHIVSLILDAFTRQFAVQLLSMQSGGGGGMLRSPMSQQSQSNNLASPTAQNCSIKHFRAFSATLCTVYLEFARWIGKRLNPTVSDPTHESHPGILASASSPQWLLLLHSPAFAQLCDDRQVDSKHEHKHKPKQVKSYKIVPQRQPRTNEETGDAPTGIVPQQQQSQKAARDKPHVPGKLRHSIQSCNHAMQAKCIQLASSQSERIEDRNEKQRQIVAEAMEKNDSILYCLPIDKEEDGENTQTDAEFNKLDAQHLLSVQDLLCSIRSSTRLLHCIEPREAQHRMSHMAIQMSIVPGMHSPFIASLAAVSVSRCVESPSFFCAFPNASAREQIDLTPLQQRTVALLQSIFSVVAQRSIKLAAKQSAVASP